MTTGSPALKTTMYPIAGILFLLALLFSFSVNAVSDDVWLVTAQNDIEAFNNKLESFNASQDDASLLGKLEKTLSAHKTRAQKCVDEITPLADRLKSDIANLDTGTETAKTGNGTGPTKNTLDELHLKTDNQLKTCQAILLNAQNLIDKIHSLQSKILADYLLSRGDTVFTSLKRNLNTLGSAVTSLRKFTDSRIRITSFHSAEWAALIITSLLAWLLGLFLGKKLHSRAGTVTGETITDRLVAAVYACMGRSLPILTTLLAAGVVIIALLPLRPIPTSVALVGSLIIYMLTIVSARILLNPCAPAKYFFVLDASFAASLYKRLQFLLVLGLFAVFATATSISEILTQPQWELTRAAFMSLMVINLVWLISYLHLAPGLLGSALLRGLVSITFIVSLLAELAGYRNLAGYLFKGIFGSILLGIALWLINALLQDTLDSLDVGRRRWANRLRSRLQLKKDQSIPGILWIRLLSAMTVWLFFILSMLQLWRYSDSGWGLFLQVLKDGFSIGEIRILPFQIAFGIAIFAVLLTFVRWFRQDTLPKWVRHTDLDHGGREAVVTISGYIGVMIAALLGLSIAGFDFTSLALIAGALSVGIGFGLQNIVNNFVSGLILLFERPIRTGDWIVVGATEGYVRKISIRSTQIETFDRADVIVPNSELISNQVTNWMLHDSWGRVTIPVGVAYGSDPQLVKKVLLDCAKEHPLVIKDSTTVNPPRVLFRSFGDSSLNFELRCFITDVDKRLSTLSDLNFAIEKSLRDNAIEIPFPQRDLHLRSVDPSIVMPDNKHE
jgi:small-conductance mechanosensitive channel